MKASWNKTSNSDAALVGCVFLIILLLIGLFLGPLIMMLAWNYGVCILIAAAAPCWNYWAFFWVDLFIGCIGVKFYNKNYTKE